MTHPDEHAKLRATLALTQDELAQARLRLEVLAEDAAAEADDARRLEILARELNTHLSEHLSPASGVRGWLKRRFIPTLVTGDEVHQVRVISESEFFDPIWYLIQHPEVAGTGMPPAVHYLRSGAGAGFEPGPNFDTPAYRRANAALGRMNPLLHLHAARTSQ